MISWGQIKPEFHNEYTVDNLLKMILNLELVLSIPGKPVQFVFVGG